jgi:hypothetical protein
MHSPGSLTSKRLAAMFVLALPAPLSVLPSCSAPAKGSLMLAITTDMRTPKDIDVVSVYVSTNGVPRFDYLGRVLPDGTVSLPSTLAIVEPDDPSAQVHIRVTAFQTQADGSARARVLRDVVTTVPHQRTSLLRLPLSFLDDGSARGTLPPRLVPDSARGVPEGDTAYDPTTPLPSDPGYLSTACDFTRQETSVAGTCRSASVDSNRLDPYSDGAVFGDGGTAASPSCFDVSGCLAQAQPITSVDMGTCSFPIAAGEDGKDWNCGLLTTDGTGTCAGNKCFVPLDSDPVTGFTVQPGVRVTMTPGVCKKLAAGVTLYVDRSSCATKVAASPVCESPGTAVPTSDAGTDAPAPAADATTTEGGAFDATLGGEGGTGASCQLPDGGLLDLSGTWAGTATGTFSVAATLTLSARSGDSYLATLSLDPGASRGVACPTSGPIVAAFPVTATDNGKTCTLAGTDLGDAGYSASLSMTATPTQLSGTAAPACSAPAFTGTLLPAPPVDAGAGG